MCDHPRGRDSICTRGWGRQARVHRSIRGREREGRCEQRGNAGLSFRRVEKYARIFPLSTEIASLPPPSNIFARGESKTRALPSPGKSRSRIPPSRWNRRNVRPRGKIRGGKRKPGNRVAEEMNARVTAAAARRGISRFPITMEERAVYVL